jgi:hypothetical protein
VDIVAGASTDSLLIPNKPAVSCNLPSPATREGGELRHSDDQKRAIQYKFFYRSIPVRRFQHSDDQKRAIQYKGLPKNLHL